ncbi:Tat pathway signal sequence domain protein [beta proteobacterium AAP51]|nr:Tat pathway signal sequence domain protein [beta proteobacterium AAP51]
MSEHSPRLNRRQFVGGGAVLGVASASGHALAAGPAAAASTVAAGPTPGAGSSAPARPQALRWLDGQAPALHAGVTWGLPWARGQCPRGTAFVLRDPQGQPQPLQTWPLAWWPDGSLKWTGHAIAPGVSVGDGSGASGAGWQVQPLPAGQAAPSTPSVVVTVEEGAEAVTVNTGTVVCVVPRRGPVLVRSVTRRGVEVMRQVQLVAQSSADASGSGELTAFEGVVEQLHIEQRGPQRAVLRLRGQHRVAQPGTAGPQAPRAWLPFDLRLYFYAGGDALRVMHSWVFDGEPQRDFIRGLGLRFDVPLRDAPHDRHVRFAAEGEGPNGQAAYGLWAEAVRGLTGLRRDPGAAVRAAQLAGQRCPPPETWQHASVRRFLERIPAWGDVSLSQLGPDSFQIKKRTRAGHTWVHSAWGGRAAGLGYVGDTQGGVAFGLRDFWQRHPAQLDIRNAHTASAQVSCWFWAPEAPAMDLRPYHDGLGQDTFEKQLEGLEVTYEDWEPGFDTAVGVGRSHELTLFALPATPSRERLVQLAGLVQTPPLLVAAPQRYLDTRVFGTLWTLPDRSTPQKAALEDRLDFVVKFYQDQAEQRRWTGFWDYGDVHHTFDADRHEWRYDVGGYAWANSELSPDLWLWSMFLRSGRADIFRFAEAMVRHTTEVDTYHLGRFKGLGTRHGVLHWSDSAKQLRISTGAYRRQYFYLTADERIGDVLDMLTTADRQLIALNPTRKIKDAPKLPPGQAVMGVGTDWGSMLANWLTAWERSGDARWRDRIARGMASVAAMPRGFFSASGAGYDPETGALSNLIGERASASHLSAVFGLVEMLAELAELIEVPGFEKAWLQYCRLYNAPVEEQRRELGMPHGGTNALTVGHSRLTAYAAMRLNDPALARRAWAEMLGDRRFGNRPLATTRIEGPAVLRPVDVAPWVSTNDAAQWSLAAMQNLAWVGAHLPKD